jgi:pantoate--beta-alanine ligase
MQLIKTADFLTKHLSFLRTEDKNVTVGFIPTMGALHAGHLSLVEESVKQNDVTVCSIFVNPTQFGEEQDLVTYPKPIADDIRLLTEANCTVLFLPPVEEVYPKAYKHKTYALDGLDLKIEGASRPGHFQGVCNVLDRLFTLIEPTNAYFGQKDFQQTVVVKKLVELINSPTKICVLPIAREPHGLAMSSRNTRLSDQGRKNAAFIYRALQQLKEDVVTLGVTKALDKAKQFINAQKGASLDYLVIVDTDTLEEVDNLGDSNSVAALTVVEYEGVRLLDNIYLKA